MVFFILAGKGCSTEQLPGYESVFVDLEVGFDGPFPDYDSEDEDYEGEVFNEWKWPTENVELFVYDSVNNEEGTDDLLYEGKNLWDIFRHLDNIHLDFSDSNEWSKLYTGRAEIFVKFV